MDPQDNQDHEVSPIGPSEPNRRHLPMVDPTPLALLGYGVLRPVERGQCAPGGELYMRPCPWEQCKKHIAWNGTCVLDLIDLRPDDQGDFPTSEIATRLGETEDEVIDILSRVLARPEVREAFAQFSPDKDEEHDLDETFVEAVIEYALNAGVEAAAEHFDLDLAFTTRLYKRRVVDRLRIDHDHDLEGDEPDEEDSILADLRRFRETPDAGLQAWRDLEKERREKEKAARAAAKASMTAQAPAVAALSTGPPSPPSPPSSPQKRNAPDCSQGVPTTEQQEQEQING